MNIVVGGNDRIVRCQEKKIFSDCDFYIWLRFFPSCLLNYLYLYQISVLIYLSFNHNEVPSSISNFNKLFRLFHLIKTFVRQKTTTINVSSLNEYG